MRGSAIRHLAACDRSPLIAAAFFKSTVQIWSSENSQQIGEFETTLDFGGRRLVLAADGSICVTGSWSAGLAGYSVPDGKILWHRSDLIEIQLLTVDPSGQKVFCGFKKGPLAVVDARTGVVTDRVNRALTVLFSPSGSDRLVVERDSYRIEGAHELEIPPESCRVPNAAFSPESVCIRGTRLICVDLGSGNSLWSHDLGSGSLAFVSDYEFYCVAWSAIPPHDASLLRLAPDLLNCDLVARLGRCWETTFAQSGEVLVTAQGGVYETRTGRTLTRLNFPQMDYPD
jgi:outer membrane protein assembly factor BamB